MVTMTKCLPRILIIDNDRSSIKLIEEALKEDNYHISECLDGSCALDAAIHILPDLILLDIDKLGIDGLEICRLLRQNIRLANVPVIMVSAYIDENHKDQGYEAGIDDYVTKPINFNELRRRVKSHLERTKLYIQSSPLTGLPGNISVEYKIREQLDKNEIFGVSYIDIDQFKSYNDTYGWQEGDNVILKTSQIIANALELYGGERRFLGHLGGDDFIAIISVENAQLFAETIIREFDNMVPLIYKKADRERRYVIHRDRQGNMHCFPLLTISVAICTNSHLKFVHTGQIVQIGLEIKEYLKTLFGSNYLIDRRIDSSNFVKLT